MIKNILKHLSDSTFKFNYRLHEISENEESSFLSDFIVFFIFLILLGYAWPIARIPNAHAQLSSAAAIREFKFFVLKFLTYDLFPVVFIFGVVKFITSSSKISKVLEITLAAWISPAFLRIFLEGIPSIFPNVAFYPLPFVEVPQLVAYVSGLLNLYTVYKYTGNKTGFDKFKGSAPWMFWSWPVVLILSGVIMFWMPIYKAYPMFVEAPDFTLPALDGGTCKLSDYKGKKVVLEMWSVRCPHCRREAGELEKLSEKLNSSEYAIVSVHVWGGKNAAPTIKTVFKHSGKVKICLDNGEVWKKYKELPKHVRPAGIPHIMLLDEYGVIQKVLRGFRSEGSIRSELKRIGR